jgi:hypothetical protein
MQDKYLTLLVTPCCCLFAALGYVVVYVVCMLCGVPVASNVQTDTKTADSNMCSSNNIHQERNCAATLGHSKRVCALCFLTPYKTMYALIS